MLATVNNRDFERPTRRASAGARSRREPLDRARRGHYLALLRRWTRDRLPAGAGAARDADEWICEDVLDAGDAEAERTSESLLVRLRRRLLADRSFALRARIAGESGPSSRVEQWIGRDQVALWEDALARLPSRQRELVILRIEFDLDDAAIAAEIGTPLAATRAATVNALAALIDALGRCRRAA